MPENYNLSLLSPTTGVSNSLIQTTENEEIKKKPTINSIFTVPNANEINSNAGAYIT